MTPETLVRARVMALSTPAGARVYMLTLPQQPTLPAVRVQRISGGLNQQLRGPSPPHVARVQVDCYATTYAAAEVLALAIRGNGLGPSATGLWGWIGSMGSPAIDVLNIEVPADVSVRFDADEHNFARISTDYLVHWKDAA